ncbi:MAG: hypothetical protein OXC02_11040 [Rhodobacteraceae bacterium]|nr:hypothetical protein [Paracoccaceae bacterium]
MRSPYQRDLSDNDAIEPITDTPGRVVMEIMKYPPQSNGKFREKSKLE